MLPKIIVLTPVKNESWILERFLRVTSEFADAIIIADQNSTDGSKQLYKNFPKVHCIDNSGSKYDEFSRQKLLIESARRLIPGDNLFLTLDSDEILTATSMHTPDWKTMMASPKGTTIYVEKPDLLAGLEECVRYEKYFPIGFMDDGLDHQGQFIHSTRVPIRSDSTQLYLSSVKVLHYAFTRPEAQRAKVRYYAAVENLDGRVPLRRRRAAYSSRKNWTDSGRVTKVDSDWFKYWESIGIDMKSTPKTKYYWQDFEMLKLFQEHGARRFWDDDIWDCDWKECQKIAVEKGLLEPSCKPINCPGNARIAWGRFGDQLHQAIRSMRSAVGI